MAYGGWAPKDPSDVKEYKFDFAALTNGRVNADADFLDSGETISTRTVTVPTGITKDSDSITDTNTSVIVWLSGGTDKKDYLITCQITTSANRTIEKSAWVRVRNQ